jgi:hypothetical protein
MSDNQFAKKVDACGNDGKYPHSPDLDPSKYPEPKKIDDSYIKNKKLDQIRDSLCETKETAETAADEKKGVAIAAAETEKLQAKSEIDKAEGIFKIEKDKLDAHTKNKKKQYWMEYNKSLREALLSPSPDSDNCEKHVHEHQRAIFVSTLKKNLATEDVTYRTAYKALRDTLDVAENAWKIAMDKYDSSICIAHAQEVIDVSDAELAWRQGLNDAFNK